MPHPLPRIAALCALWFSTPILAGDELTPERLAEVHRDEQKAVDKVNQAHGNKQSSEMDAEERRAIIQEQREASQAALNKDNVDPKEYARREATLSREERAREAQAAQALDAKEADEKRAAAAKADEEKKAAEASHEVVIRRGYGEDQPVDVTDNDDAPPASEADPTGGSAGAPGAEQGKPAAEKPAKASSSSKKGHGKQQHPSKGE